LRAAATDSLKLGLDTRTIGIRQQTVDMLERALELALTVSGIGSDGRAEARGTFRKNIRVAPEETALPRPRDAAHPWRPRGAVRYGYARDAYPSSA
jgi:hypothetical protein